MPLQLSAYFDLVRIAAALVVAISHTWQTFIPAHPQAWPGHEAVVVFFVLSGYVVAYVADTKEKNIREFAISRAVRILSVSVAALILTMIVSIIADPDWPAQIWPIIQNLFFVAQNWFNDQSPKADNPYWSLCYEVWYYAIFAAAWYSKALRSKIITAGALAIIAGPKIILMMPCWMLGCALYWSRNNIKMKSGIAVAAFALSAAACLIYLKFDVGAAIREAMHATHPQFIAAISGSNEFIGDIILATLISINFAAVASMGPLLQFLVSTRDLWNRAAAFTLSIYLYHYPMMTLLQHLGVKTWIGIPLTIGAAISLAPFTEMRRFAMKKYIKSWLHMRASQIAEPAGLHPR